LEDLLLVIYTLTYTYSYTVNSKTYSLFASAMPITFTDGVYNTTN